MCKFHERFESMSNDYKENINFYGKQWEKIYFHGVHT